MIMKARNHPVILFLAAVFIFAAPAAGRADNLFRLFPEAQINGFYADNIPLRTVNEQGGFGTAMVAGFFLDYTSAARYASLHYDTFAQLFTHQTELDRAGEGQFVSAVDDENLSPTTKLHFDEFFYRDAPAIVAITTSDQSPQFNSVLALLLLGEDQASVNQFNAELTHAWGHNWTSELSVHQETYWANNTNSNNNNTSFYQGVTAATDYHFTERFSLGVGNRFYDFRFTNPGQPGELADWPFVRASWTPIENFYVEGTVGAVISHTQGQSSNQVNPAGLALLEYRFRRGRLSINGGQEPALTTVFGGVGEYRGVNGNVLYYFTRRLTGSVGGSFYDFTGPQRVNKWLSVNTRFVEIRRNETGTNQFLPSGNQNGQWAVGNYYIVGLAVSIEAFRWSWQ
jgi:hypothetical protein